MVAKHTRWMSLFLVAVAALGAWAPLAAAQTDAVWLGGVGDWMLSSNWDIGVVPNDGGGTTYHVYIDSGNAVVSQVTLNGNVAIYALTLDADDLLTIANSRDLYIGVGGLYNAGVLELSSTGANTYLYLNGGPVSFTGGGTIRMSATTPNWIQATNGGSLVNVDNTIEGGGNVGHDQSAIDNQGTIVATVAAPLALDPSSAGLTNSNVLRADGGTLQLLGGPYYNTGGVIEALSGSAVVLDNGAAIYGGTLQTADDGEVRTKNHPALIGDPDVVTNAGLLRIPNSEYLHVRGTIENTGTIQLDSNGGNTYLHPDGGVATFTGGGTIQMSAYTPNWIYAINGGSLVNVDNTIQGGGNVGYDQSAIENQGTIVATVGVPLAVDPSPAGLTNTGTLRANGGTLRLDAGPYYNTGGVIEALSSSAVVLANGAAIYGGTLQTTGDGEVRTTAHPALVGDPDPVTNAGLLRIPNGEYLHVRGTVHNTGTIRLDSNGGNTYLYFDGGVARFTGFGEIILSNNSQNWMYGINGGSLENANNTIHGGGRLGYNQSAIVNSGAIIADASTPLIVEPSSAGLTNSSVLRADGGLLRLSTGLYINTDGVIEARDGSQVSLADNVSIQGGTLYSEGSGEIVADSGTCYLYGLSNAGQLRVANGKSMHMRGQFNNTGTIRVDSDGGNTYLHASGGVARFVGGGQIVLSNYSPNWFYAVGGGSIDNADNTIRGAGNIGYDQSGIINSGTIVANVSNALTLDPSGDGLTNHGVLRADGGTLQLAGGPFANADGMIEARDGSTVLMLGGAAIYGGTLQTAGSGEIRGGSGVSYVIGDPDVVNNTGVLRVANGEELHVRGTINNTGTIRVDSNGGNTNLYPDGGVARFTGGGEIVMSNFSPNWFYAIGGGSIDNVDNTIHGAGHLGHDQSGIVNSGTILADVTNPLVVDPSNDGLTNHGVLRADGGTLQLAGGPYANADGVIEARDGSTVLMLGGAAIYGGTLQTEGSGEIRSGAGASYLIGDPDVVNNTGLLRVANGEELHVRGTINNTGTIRLDSDGGNTYLYPDGGVAQFVGGGEIIMSDFWPNWFFAVGGGSIDNVDNTIRGAGRLGHDQSGIVNSGTIIADGGHALEIDGDGATGFLNTGELLASGSGGMQILAGPFTTSGAVTVEAGSGLARTGVYEQTDGTTSVAGVLSASGGIDLQGGLLEGDGTVAGSVLNAAEVAPGFSAGMLVIQGAYEQTSSGQLTIDIGGPNAEIDYDVLNVGAATLDGTLRIARLNRFQPTVGATFTVLTADSITGEFLGGVQLPAGWTGHAVYNTTDVTIEITGVVKVGDVDADGDVDVDDLDLLADCMNGPDITTPPPGCDPLDFAEADVDDDGDVDLADCAIQQLHVTGPTN